MSTSLSCRTLVRLAYEPCAKTSIFRVLSFLLASIALRTARSAFSHFVCSVVLGAPPQVQKTSSQLRFRDGAVRHVSSSPTGRPDQARLFASVTRTEFFLPVRVGGRLGCAENLHAGEVRRSVVFGPWQLVSPAIVAGDQPGEALPLHGGMEPVIVGPLWPREVQRESVN